ncbi:hypothetical protein [Novosphingobium taihuense]|uniref:Uncharacterized protein n=1 Tax=Novosphingobium taihuense TaxID=260085 RepID=A0A7W7A7J3_9SPHN|nr:hypothetical protein [Novosphingobium taihuense]MBB4611878.1 hypothetical protein [Novosphingobium taihuense]
MPRSSALQPCAQGRREPAFLLRQPNPPAFPEHLILPVRRGAVIASVPWPEAPAIETPSAPKEPRKVAKGKSAARKRRPPSARKAPTRRPVTAKKAARKQVPAAPSVAAAIPPAKEAPAAMTTIDLLDRALAIEPELPPVRPHPASPLESLSATASQDVVDVAPLPRSRAPTLPRGSGLLDVIGDWLRSTARALAFWRMFRQRQTTLERTHLARANAHQRALQSQFEALEALNPHTKS